MLAAAQRRLRRFKLEFFCWWAWNRAVVQCPWLPKVFRAGPAFWRWRLACQSECDGLEWGHTAPSNSCPLPPELQTPSQGIEIVVERREWGKSLDSCLVLSLMSPSLHLRDDDLKLASGSPFARPVQDLANYRPPAGDSWTPRWRQAVWLPGRQPLLAYDLPGTPCARMAGWRLFGRRSALVGRIKPRRG